MDTQKEKHMQKMLAYACSKSPNLISKEFGSYSSHSDKYDINLSSTETALIKAAATCDRFASDLFIDWAAIKDKISDASEKPRNYCSYHVFGFRESGVDGNSYVYVNLDNYKFFPDKLKEYYQLIYCLKIEKSENDIRTSLYDITDSIRYYDDDTSLSPVNLTPKEIYTMICRFKRQNVMIRHETDEKYKDFEELHLVLGKKIENLVAFAENDEKSDVLCKTLVKINDIIRILIHDEQHHITSDKKDIFYESVKSWFEGNFHSISCICNPDAHNDMFISYIASLCFIDYKL